ncbi:MAG TPA: hypothetical protein PK095_21200, partial [Myxococcota bacterium]|nr:hypothetical protein [Myxococcota bacterium]
AALQGDNCAAPFVATGITDATSYTLTVDTCSFGGDFNASSSAGGCAPNSGTTHRDFVVAFTPPEAGTYVVTSTQPVDLIMNIVEGACPGASYGTCRAGTDNGTSAPITDVTPDQTFYIVVDHWQSVTCTTARNTTFTITKQCTSTGCGDSCNTVDNCGNACNCGAGEECSTSGAEGPGVCEFVGFPLGENCSNPYVVGDVPVGTPYTHTVDTCTFVDDIRQESSSNGCGFASTGGKDFFVAFTPTVSGRYNVTSTQTNADLVVNVVSGTCPTASAASCVGGNDASNVSFNGTAGTTYHIYVDGYDSGDCGSTVFTISQLPPALEVIEGCPTDICTMAAGAGPNGGDLYTYTIPANQHPSANDFAAPTGCTGWGTGPDLLVVLPSAGYTQVTSSTCTATAADTSLAVFSSDPRVAGPTLLGCSADSPGGTSFCSRVGEVPSGSTSTTP